MAKLSVIVLTKNEEASIKECLETVKWADEIIIIDDESSDSTREIASFYTSKIIINKMAGFGLQRQFGIEQAQGEWILFVDADERIPPEVQKEIFEIMQDSHGFYGFGIKKRTFFLGKEIKYCGWDAPVLRLFRKDKAKSDLSQIHEKIEITGKVGCLSNYYIHYSYRSISHYLNKLDLYAGLQAEKFFKEGERVNIYNAALCFIVKPKVAFIRKYILMKGFLDGYEGFLISVFTALAVFFNYVKLWELQRQK